MSGIECSVCLENFKNTERVYSTSCGHIFHKDCLDKCKENLPTFFCPQCRHRNPTSYRIYLNCEDSKTNENVETLKAKLTQTQLKVKEMEKLLEAEKYSEVMSHPTRSNLLSKPFGMKAAIIKGLSRRDIKIPLTETVLMLTNLMNIPCKNDDIELAFISDRKIFLKTPSSSETLNIVVKFRSLELKKLFINKKEMLISKGITLTNYVDEDTNELFKYANTLRTRGFEHVFFRSNCIYVQKTDNDILNQIYSKEDVDNIFTYLE